MDPLGFALENFDGSGDWRDQESTQLYGVPHSQDPVIDASAQLPDGTKFTGVTGLQNALLERSDAFLLCLATKTTVYALGRELTRSDRSTLDDFVTHMKQNGHTLRCLIDAIVASPAFSTK